MIAMVSNPEAIQDSTLQIELLGGFRLIYQAQSIYETNRERLKGLLAYLALYHGKSHSRSRLAGLFWGDSTEAQARANLRHELFHLRQLLPDCDRFIEIDKKTLQWRSQAPFRLDVAEFEQAIAQAETAEKQGNLDLAKNSLETAMSWYRGDLLPDFFDDWVLAEQERLKQLYIRSLEWLSRLLREQKNIRLAIRYAQQWLETDPLNEVAYSELMTLHALNGDRAKALQLYHRCMEVLRDELGVDPGPNIREVYNHLIHETDPALVPQSANSKPALELQPISIPTKPLCLTNQRPLIGRTSEWEILSKWLSNSNCSHLLLLLGEPGIGKTRLLEELAIATTEATGYVLVGQGFEAEMLRPYGAWIDALRPISNDPAIPLPAELRTFFPEREADFTPVDRNQLFDAVVRFLAHLAHEERTVLIIFDDIQWLDEASVALLHYVTRLLSHTSVHFACAARSKDLADNVAVQRFLQTFRREQRLQTVELPLLTCDQTSELARSIHTDINGEQVFMDSGGNPLFVLEIARSHQQGKPSSCSNLTVLIEERLSQLDRTARDLISWAAAIGHSFSLETVSQGLGRSIQELLEAIAKLEEEGIIRPCQRSYPAVYNFTHDLVRQVAYQRLTELQRQVIHTRIATALDQHAVLSDKVASDIAYHACLGNDPLLAVAATLRAANRCLRVFAYSEAATLAEQGVFHCQHLEPNDQIHYHIGLLKASILAGVAIEQVPVIESQLQNLIQSATRLGLKEEEATGLEALITLHYDHGNLASVHEHSLHAAEQGRTANPITTARMLAYSGWCLADIGREMQRAEALLLEAQSLAARTRISLIDISCGLGCVYRHKAEHEAAREHLTTAWKMAQAKQDHWRVCSCLTYLAMLEIEAGKAHAARTYTNELASVAAQMEDNGSEGAFAIALQALANYHLTTLNAAIEIEEAIQLLYKIDAKRMLAYVLTAAAEIDLVEKRSSKALARAEAALKAAQIVNQPSEIALAWATLVRGMLQVGQVEQALSLREVLVEQLAQPGLSDRAQKAVSRLLQAINLEYKNPQSH